MTPRAPSIRTDNVRHACAAARRRVFEQSFSFLVKHRFLFLLASSAALPAFADTQTLAHATSNPDAPIRLNQVVVAAGPDTKPLEIQLDAKAPAQPVPAHDGADYLKSVPGFCVIRKGGIDGDPILRGQGGSRLNILLDGQNIFGGCGNRMDPPTAYVFPSAYDRITVIKGPQTVLHGPGATAGVVMFERETARLSEPGANLQGSLTAGSFGRHDESGEVVAGTPDFFARLAGSRSTANDYEDGSGHAVHSNYRRWSGNAALGWTPDDNTLVELSAARSDGEAAYADRTMDGAKFLRNNLGLRLRRSAVTPVVAQVEGSVYYNYADHVMDNFTLRPAPMMPMLMNPDRLTAGARAQVDLNLTASLLLKSGADFQKNMHRNRSNLVASRVQDAEFADVGLFAELSRPVAGEGRVIAGIRLDRWRAEDDRLTVPVGSGMMAATSPNPTAGARRTSTLSSGFARYEHEFLSKTLTAYAGLGTTERFPDYWELFNKESTAGLSAFDTKPERIVQLDAGILYRREAFSASASLFSNRTNDYILIQNGYAKPAMMGTRAATVTRNVDTSAFGGELSAAYTLAKALKLDASLACVRAENDTDDRPLAQQPPLEGRLGVTYSRSAWFAGASARFVGAQERFAINQGNIVGQDIGRSSGFSVFAFNAGWRPARYLQITAGVDNVFDKAYAEHISRAGSSVIGFTTTTRVNEPGRTLWAKLDLKY